MGDPNLRTKAWIAMVLAACAGWILTQTLYRIVTHEPCVCVCEGGGHE